MLLPIIIVNLNNFQEELSTILFFCGLSPIARTLSAMIYCKWNITSYNGKDYCSCQ